MLPRRQFIFVQAEPRHFRGRPESMRVLEPDRDPLRPKLMRTSFRSGPIFFTSCIKFLARRFCWSICRLILLMETEFVGLQIELLRGFVVRSLVARQDALLRLQLVFRTLPLQLFDGALGGNKVFRLGVISLSSDDSPCSLATRTVACPVRGSKHGRTACRSHGIAGIRPRHFPWDGAARASARRAHGPFPFGRFPCRCRCDKACTRIGPGDGYGVVRVWMRCEGCGQGVFHSTHAL